MKRQIRRLLNRPLLAVTCSAALVACHDEVPLGAWADALPAANGGAGSTSETTASGTGGQAGASSDGAVSVGLPSCLEPGTPGPFNPAGDVIGATETATDWTWPSPVNSMQWDLMVEREIERESPGAPPTSGYYWTYQFSFLEGAAGFFGIQAEGVYQSDPPDSPRDITKMAVFWLSGPPLAAELGDIAYPDARVAPITASGVSYLTIHARFDWQACRTYRFRIAPESTEDDGSIWYGAWIEDVQADVDTFLGRMRLPADSGAFSPFSISRTLPIEFGTPTSCDVPAYGSVLFGRPHTVEGDKSAVGANRFADPLACPSSRFTNFEGAVRHEQGVRP